MMDSDIKSCLESVDWCRADYEYFRGGGFSSHFKTMAEMPVTMLRINLVDGVGPTIQIAEGYTVVIDEEIHKYLDEAYKDTMRILQENIEVLHAMAKALMEVETINHEQIMNLFAYHQLNAPEPETTVQETPAETVEQSEPEEH